MNIEEIIKKNLMSNLQKWLMQIFDTVVMTPMITLITNPELTSE